MTEFRVDASSPAHIERVEVKGVAKAGGLVYGSYAVLRRFGRPVVTFIITPGQVVKVMRKRGKFVITERAIRLASELKRW